MTCICTKCQMQWTREELVKEIWDTDLSRLEKKQFGKTIMLTDEIRMSMRKIGWFFGNSVYNIKQCPGCPINQPIKFSLGKTT